MHFDIDFEQTTYFYRGRSGPDSEVFTFMEVHQ